MKKSVKSLLLLIFFLSFTLCFGVTFFSRNEITGLANSPTQTETTMFMPASRLEFYDLKSPQAICYQDGYLIITEYHKDEFGNETNKLIVYNPTVESYEVNLSPTLVNVTCVSKYGNYLLLLIDSAIFTLPLDDITGTPTDTGIRVGKSFSVNKNAVVTNTSSGIYKYNMTETPTGITFDKIDENYVTGVLSCLLANNGDFYYFVSGKGLIRRRSDGIENVIYKSVPEVDIAPSHMAEFGAYVYFTAPSGLYKVKKEENSPLTKIIPVSDGGGLGTLSAPAGITIKDGKLLVADTNLNCIQEIELETDGFTEFAVTTESTADYRLTNNAKNLVLSENYVYALDNSTFKDGDVEPQKRIVKISLDQENKSYEKIDLTAVYEEFPDVTDFKFTASDTHVLISNSSTVTLYEQVLGKPITLKKVYQAQKNANAVFYLDNDFYFVGYHVDVYNANASYTQIYKITLPNQDNELTEIKLTTLTKNDEGVEFSKEILGHPLDMTVDIFGNVYLLTTNDEKNATTYKIQRYFSGNVLATNEIDKAPLSIETDFAGNVYALFENSVLHKYSFDTQITREEFKINSPDNSVIKDLCLNYRSHNVYYLSNACILISKDDVLQVQNLSKICADTVKPYELQTTQKFITVDKNAKLFKVRIGDYFTEDNKNYFKTIEPISNPNTTKIYLIIAEVEDDYYLISYSKKFTALVKKSSVQINSSTSLIPPENYEVLNITDVTLKEESFIITNDVKLFSRPIFDDNYVIGEVNAGNVVKTSKLIIFNDKSFILVKNEGGVEIGYVPSGYLEKEVLLPSTSTTITNETIYGNGQKRARSILMVILIAFTITASALFLEYKLLFKQKT